MSSSGAVRKYNPIGPDLRTLEDKLALKRKLLTAIVTEQTEQPLPHAHLDFLIVDLDIKIHECQPGGQKSGSAERWNEILKPAMELKELIMKHPHDEQRVKALMQEVVTSVNDEFGKNGLEIEFTLEGLERL
ncbi:hypothetical protein MFIFM68171_06297 [Madurella fahalii]|uniref:Uncharacterized protein n=1 Tax=Madurella fahalii TaxID=1157608 RepID=A0ABQ0GEA1_9PEZI